jgi:hypothetical protein
MIGRDAKEWEVGWPFLAPISSHCLAAPRPLFGRSPAAALLPRGSQSLVAGKSSEESQARKKGSHSTEEGGRKDRGASLLLDRRGGGSCQWFLILLKRLKIGREVKQEREEGKEWSWDEWTLVTSFCPERWRSRIAMHPLLFSSLAMSNAVFPC